MAVNVFDPTIDGAFIDGNNAAPVSAPVFSVGNGTYSIDTTQGFHGSYHDFFTFDPSLNIASFSLAGFDNHATLEVLHGSDPATFIDVGPVITYTVTYDDGTSGFPFGGILIGTGADGSLVQQISGFFDLGVVNPDTGGEEFIGTLTTTYQIFENTTNLSLKSGTPPTLPLEFQSTGAGLNCFQSGTHLRTESGEIRVDQLRTGDRVAVIEGSEIKLKPVIWVGHRRIDIASYPQPNVAQTIRITRNAFAEGVPVRDLLVSPDHAIFVDDMLIPAKLLVNGGSIFQDPSVREIHYFHVELERHGVLIAEGVPAESYLDCGTRHNFENGGSTITLWPNFFHGSKASADRSCYRLAEDAESVHPVWVRLAKRSSVLGFVASSPVTITDPGFKVIAAGREILPAYRDSDRYVFVLPANANANANANATAMELVSRSVVPGDIEAWLSDRRRLGVLVLRISLRSEAELFDIALDSPALGEGWWGVEQSGCKAWRRTDGKARIALSREQEAHRILEVQIAGGMDYIVQPLAIDEHFRAA